jgi:hypothetical protein
MRIRRQKRTRAVLAALSVAGVVLAALAGAALASVIVYTNGFSTRSEVKQLANVEGRHCGKKGNGKSLRIVVRGGRDSCGYRPPVASDGKQPDYDFQARMKLLPETIGRLRAHVYLAIAVRSGKGEGYELRIFPANRRFRLLRNPGASNDDFPVTGKEKGIRHTGRWNTLRLRAFGDHVKAFINGVKVGNVTDPNPDEVGGRRLEVIVNNGRNTQRDALARVDKLRLAVPRH